MQARDLIQWSKQVQSDMLAEESVRDVSSVQMLQEQHNQLKAEIDAREDNFSSVVATGRGMIENGHFASQEVIFCPSKFATEPFRPSVD